MVTARHPALWLLGAGFGPASRALVERQQAGLQSWLWLVTAAAVGAEHVGVRGVQREQ